MNEDERRKYVRLDSKIISWYQLPPDGNLDAMEILGRVTKNIGAGGLLVEMTEQVPLGSTLSMDLKLPGEKGFIKGKVRVVRIEELGEGRYDVGLAFVELDEEGKKIIGRFISEHRE